jgi:hypothetical protein
MTRAAVPAGRASSTGALTRIEARHLARSPLLWLGVVLGAALVALEMSWYLPALAGDDVVAYRAGGFLVGGGALLAGAWLALRDRTTGAAELVAATPTAPWRPWRARVVAVAATAGGVFAAGFTVAMAVSAARGGRGAPDLRLLADGMLAVVLSGWVGVAVGRLSGSRMVAVLAAPVWVVVSVLVALLGQARGPSLSVQHLAPVLNLLHRSAAYGFLPDPLWPHLGYLLGLTLVVGAVLVALMPRGGRRGAMRSVLVIAAAGLVLSGTAGARLLALPDAVLVLGLDRDTWRPVEGELSVAGDAVSQAPGWSFPDDGHARACAGDATLSACVYPAYGQREARFIHEAAAPVAAVLAGLPGVPTRIRMVPGGLGGCGDAEVLVSEVDARERSLRGDQQVRWHYAWRYLDCALGPDLGADHHSPGEAGEAVASWALLAGGLLTVQEVARDAEASPVSSRVASAAALAMAALPADRVRAELAPRWDRLRAGTLRVAELPGQRP